MGSIYWGNRRGQEDRVGADYWVRGKEGVDILLRLAMIKNVTVVVVMELIVFASILYFIFLHWSQFRSVEETTNAMALDGINLQVCITSVVKDDRAFGFSTYFCGRDKL